MYTKKELKKIARRMLGYGASVDVRSTGNGRFPKGGYAVTIHFRAKDEAEARKAVKDLLENFPGFEIPF
jgi:hypothetical protein